MTSATPHPTAGRCKRCGEPLPRLWIDWNGRQVAERWCSDHCYGVELQEQTARMIRAQRIGNAAPRQHEEHLAA